MRGALSYQEHLMRFFGTRLQKDFDMLRALSGPQVFEQVADCERRGDIVRAAVEDEIHGHGDFDDTA